VEEAAQEVAAAIKREKRLKVKRLKLKVKRPQPALEVVVEAPEAAEAQKATAKPEVKVKRPQPKAVLEAAVKAPEVAEAAQEAATKNPPPKAEATTKTPKTSWSNGRRKCQK